MSSGTPSAYGRRACSALRAGRLFCNAALARSSAKSSPAVYSASSTPPLSPVMSQTAALPSNVPLELSKLRVEHTQCTAGGSLGRPDRAGGMYPLLLGVTMSLHKLTAGSGYDCLTRQVAALDATEKGHTGLASYYTERGETPGVWIGSGLERDRRPDRRRPGDCRADASVVRLRSAPVGRAPPAAAGRTGPHSTRLPRSDPTG